MTVAAGWTVRRRRAALWLLSAAGATAALAAGAGYVARGDRWGPQATWLPGVPRRAAPAAAQSAGRSEADDRLRVSTTGWRTDFSKHTVPLGELMSGGPGKDGIPPLDRPTFEAVDQTRLWLRDPEPVIAFELGGAARAYPLQVLIWHEIVNDTVAGTPVAVTFCPLCNTAIVFDRRLEGVTYDFGTTGNLRHSDLVMWDRQTESWWQQATGEAIVGALTGKRLAMLPAAIVSWQEFSTTWPKGEVLSRDTGFSRSYGRNPYVGYDDVNRPPFLFRGPTDGRLPPMERVLLVEVPRADGEAGSAFVVYPFSMLAERRVIHDTVAGRPLVALWAPGTASALDGASIAASRDVGAAAAFLLDVAARAGAPEAPEMPDASGGASGDADGGRRLTLRPDPQTSGRFRDEQTGSTWNIAGRAIAGPLQGQRLPPLIHGNHFWFAAAAFRPEAELRLG